MRTPCLFSLFSFLDRDEQSDSFIHTAENEPRPVCDTGSAREGSLTSLVGASLKAKGLVEYKAVSFLYELLVVDWSWLKANYGRWRCSRCGFAAVEIERWALSRTYLFWFQAGAKSGSIAEIPVTFLSQLSSRTGSKASFAGVLSSYFLCILWINIYPVCLIYFHSVGPLLRRVSRCQEAKSSGPSASIFLVDIWACPSSNSPARFAFAFDGLEEL